MPKAKVESALTEEQRFMYHDLMHAKSSKDLKVKYTRMMKIVPVPSEEVKAARKALKQSQSQLADWLGVSVQTVQAWEAGRRKPEAVVSKVLRYALIHPEWIREFSNPALWGPPVKVVKAKKPLRHLQAA